MTYIIRRLSEPSTWAGIAAIAYGVGQFKAGLVIENLGPVLAGIFGAAAVLLPERRK